MAKYFIEDTTLTAIADTIREQAGSTEILNPLQMANKVPEVYKSGQESMIGDKDMVTETISHGEVVSLFDVSPIKHEMTVSVRGKNLCPIASVTGDDKHKVIFEGDITGTFTFSYTKNFSSSENTGGVLFAFIIDGVTVYRTILASTEYTFSGNLTKITFPNYCKAVGTAENIQLEEAVAATAYTPYIDSLEGIEVLQYNGNLLDAKKFAAASTYNTTFDGFAFTTKFEQNTVYFNGSKKHSFKAGAYTAIVVPLSSNMYFSLYAYSANEPTRVIKNIGKAKANEPFHWYFTSTEDFFLCLGGYRCNEGSNNEGDGTFSYGIYLIEGEYSEPIVHTTDTNGFINGIESTQQNTFFVSKGTTITANYNKKNSWYDIFWDEIQDYGIRTRYQSAFRDWNSEKIEPKYNIPTTTLYEMFYFCKKLQTFPWEKITTTEFTSATSMCYYCSAIEEVDIVIAGSGTPSSSFFTNSFANCKKLKRIKKIIASETMGFSGCFTNCTELEEVTFEGTIAANNLNLQWSNKLSHDSIMSIINSLADKSADTSNTTWTVTLGDTNIAKLTEDEKVIATAKGWVLG